MAQTYVLGREIKRNHSSANVRNNCLNTFDCQMYHLRLNRGDALVRLTLIIAATYNFSLTNQTAAAIHRSTSSIAIGSTTGIMYPIRRL